VLFRSIHRYGQLHDPVIIVNLVAPATREGHVLKTLLDKLEKIRKQLKSDKVFDSIGRVFAGVSIREYMERAHEEVVECRLVGIRQNESSDISECPVEHLLLLRGGQGLPSQGQRLAVAAAKLRDQSNAYLMERVCRGMAVAHRTRIMDALPKRESFVERGFDFKEAELATARAKLSSKARDGNKGAVTELAQIKRQQRELQQRQDHALAIIRREPELLVPGSIDFIAHALVVPSNTKADREQLEANVEQIAMNLTKAHEEACGATVCFVHTPELARAASFCQRIRGLISFQCVPVVSDAALKSRAEQRLVRLRLLTMSGPEPATFVMNTGSMWFMTAPARHHS
ncbi:MAG: hypothetical protein PHO37_15755, partial [Kiritimatiellae bacterium]|nr:hypothetical protein [Kiritimatiellia bacterium]